MSNQEMIGKKFGRLTVLEKAIRGKDYNVSEKDKHIYWKCQCECGNITIAQGSQLRSGKRVSCGCSSKEKAAELAKKLGEQNRPELIGKKFGSLEVVGLAQTNPTLWLCKCSCGNFSKVLTYNLMNGHTRTCGCGRKGGKMSRGEEKIVELLKKANITFQREKIFEDIGSHKYRFDFYLKDLNICIEYDGEQHFQQISYYQKTRTDFLKQKENDRKKNSYCLAHNIPLYRIPYWEMDKLSCDFDLFKNQYRVCSKWHNDNLKPPK